jgi:hypothetical protein
MKKLAIIMLLVLCSLALAKSDIGFKGVGGQIAFVMPKDPIDNTIGLGGNAYLGKIMPDLKLFAYVDYWGKTYKAGDYAETSFSVFSIMAVVRYGFKTSGNIKPYVGGGLGLDIASVSSDYTGAYSEYYGDSNTSDSSSDLGILLMGGASTMLSSDLEGFAEIRYNTDTEAFGIYVGATYLLK